MLRAFALASMLSLCASAVLAQPPGDPALSPPPGDPNASAAQPPSQGGYPLPSQDGPAGGSAPSGYGQGGYGQGGGSGQGGYGPGGYGQGGGGGHAPADPQTRALRQQVRAACATDISTYCANVGEGGRGALHQCMMANQTRFSAPCQGAMADLRAYMHQMRMQGGAPGAPPPPSDMPPSQPPPQ